MIRIAILESRTHLAFEGTVLTVLLSSESQRNEEERGLNLVGVVDDMVTGMLVRPGDHRDLARAIIELCKNEELRGQLADAGYAKVLTEYEVDEVARRIREIFEESRTTLQSASSLRGRATLRKELER